MKRKPIPDTKLFAEAERRASDPLLLRPPDYQTVANGRFDDGIPEREAPPGTIKGSKYGSIPQHTRKRERDARVLLGGAA